MDISYAAHTASCTFLLDSKGICRRVVVASAKGDGRSHSAARCVGAQYVASLDPKTPGGLVDMPRVGAPMLFARVDDGGRVSLARTGALLRFESHAKGSDPFVASQSVETSAPHLDTFNLRDSVEEFQKSDGFRFEDEDDFETTQDLVTAEYQAVRPKLRAPLPLPKPSRPPPSSAAARLVRPKR